MRWNVAALLLLISVIVAGQEEDSGKLDRVREIEGWSSAVGTREGSYIIEAAPKELLQSIRGKGTDNRRIGIKLVLREDEAFVYFKFEPGSEWTGAATDAHLIPDKIAWHVLMSDEGSVWLERYFLSFMRVEEEVANFVITRTVHNWYDVAGEDAPTTYHVFGSGEVTRAENSECPLVAETSQSGGKLLSGCY